MKLPPYDIFPTLNDERITLREILNSDLGDIIEISYYDSIPATTLQEAFEMQEKINFDYRSGNSIHWGIADRTTNKILGTCGYYRGFQNDAGELGCILLPQHRGQGFMTRAMLLAINFGKNVMGLKNIFAVTSKQNINAVKLLKRLNFNESATSNDHELEYVLNNY